MASTLIIAAVAGALSGLPAAAAPVTAVPHVIPVAGDCSAAAARVVAQTGGELLSATLKGNMCEIIVLVKEQGQERRTRVKRTVPL